MSDENTYQKTPSTNSSNSSNSSLPPDPYAELRASCKGQKLKNLTDSELFSRIQSDVDKHHRAFITSAFPANRNLTSYLLNLIYNKFYEFLKSNGVSGYDPEYNDPLLGEFARWIESGPRNETTHPTKINVLSHSLNFDGQAIFLGISERGEPMYRLELYSKLRGDSTSESSPMEGSTTLPTSGHRSEQSGHVSNEGSSGTNPEPSIRTDDVGSTEPRERGVKKHVKRREEKE